MKKSILLPIVLLILSTTYSFAYSVVQVNFDNHSSCPVYLDIAMYDSCGYQTPVYDFLTVNGNTNPTYYTLSGKIIGQVHILDGQYGSPVRTVDFCTDDLVTDDFNNGCDDMYAFADGNCCGVNPDIRDIGLLLL